VTYWRVKVREGYAFWDEMSQRWVSTCVGDETRWVQDPPDEDTIKRIRHVQRCARVVRVNVGPKLHMIRTVDSWTTGLCSSCNVIEQSVCNACKRSMPTNFQEKP
jgi:hypothetical protein